MNRPACLALTILSLAAAAAAPEAFALDNPANGKQLARQWCVSCHLVSADQDQAMADAPPFAAIAARIEVTPEGLATLLAAPHPAMPQLDLSRQQLSDLAAYIRSLEE